MALNIKNAIKSRGLEVRQVAERMGVTSVTLSRHINGNPSVDILQRIADSIGCDISELFDQASSMSLTCPHCGSKINITIES